MTTTNASTTGRMIEIDIQRALEGESSFAPPDEAIRAWAAAALAGRRGEAELTVRIVGEAEIRRFNHTYRGKDAPTNVLSFPFEAPPGVDLPLLGDVVVCAPVVEREAREQGKAAEAHWAHMVIHGVLHLLGHDHMVEHEARRMEALEVDILAGLGFPDPYDLHVTQQPETEEDDRGTIE